MTESITCRLFLLCSFLMPLAGCLGLPKNVAPVNDFSVERYLGTWYEIARFDNRFERGLRNITATYSKREDGGIDVRNRGYNIKKGEWSEALGKAYFVGSNDKAHLKVSFFGPFYASYAVFGLDKENYQYAFVSGNTTKYLWLLARTPVVSKELMTQFRTEAGNRGFNMEKLIITDQSELIVPVSDNPN